MPKRLVRREFTVPAEQGAAALLVGTQAENLRLVRMTRRGTRVIAYYADQKEATNA